MSVESGSIVGDSSSPAPSDSLKGHPLEARVEAGSPSSRPPEVTEAGGSTNVVSEKVPLALEARVVKAAVHLKKFAGEPSGQQGGAAVTKKPKRGNVTAASGNPNPRPYTCSHAGCTYAATVKCNLMAHLRTHSGERPFPCPFPDCTYAATVRCNLVVHQRTHYKQSSQPPLAQSASKGSSHVEPLSAVSSLLLL